MTSLIATAARLRSRERTKPSRHPHRERVIGYHNYCPYGAACGADGTQSAIAPAHLICEAQQVDRLRTALPAEMVNVLTEGSEVREFRGRSATHTSCSRHAGTYPCR